MNRPLFILFLIIILTDYRLTCSQSNPSVLHNRKFPEIKYEKIYLHTDRNLYSAKEYIWFKIYLTDGKTHIPISGPNNVYVDLVSPRGKILIHKPFFVFDGMGNGNFSIGDSLETGEYTLYAYTRYLLNFGTEVAYKKELTIRNAALKAGTDNIAENSLPPEKSILPKPGVNLQFMPEGGYLSENLYNNLAFMITAADGKGKNLRGALMDNNGKLIDSIQCTHLGMGKVLFKPQPGKKYYTILDDLPSDTFHLPPSCQKPLLQYFGVKDSIVRFRLSDLPGKLDEQRCYLAVKAKGELLFYLEKRITSGEIMMNIHQSNFRTGLNQTILLDSNLIPLSERLIFIPPVPGAGLEIKLEKDTFGIREKTEVRLMVPDINDASTGGSFSMAVVNLDQAGLIDLPTENIITWLELSSEIRGTIENPGEYFSQPYDTVKEHLDLLLLTRGWRRYIWDNKYIDSLPEFKNKQEYGLPIEGHAQKLLVNGALENGNIILFIPEEEIIMETFTDSSGYFHFDNLVLFDSTRIAVQSRNRKNRKNTRLIDFCYKITPPPVFPPAENDQPEPTYFINNYRNDYSHFVDSGYTDFNKSNILLGEVIVIGEKQKEDDGHFRIYSEASNVVDMDDYPDIGYSDLFMFLQGTVPGLYISGDQISIRMASKPPLILLDGTEVDMNTARTIPLSEIDKIEVLKDASNTSVFGVRGGNGVIAIYTKRGEIVYTDYPLFDIIAKSIEGFAREKEFYTPDYDNPATDPSVTDRRATIFWAPNLLPDSTGVCSVSFFNSDDSGKIAIIAEGILLNGKPLAARTYYRVNKN